MARRLVWVDVFAARPLAGNPLAVVLDAEGLDTGTMQAVAAEMGLSETVFVLPGDDRVAARLRIFTPARELAMAGHPVVGAAWVLRRERRLADAGLLETGVGPLAVSADAGGAEMTQAPPTAGPAIDPAPVAAACGVRAASSPDCRAWSTGLSQLMLPVAGADELARARPDAARLAALCDEGGWVGVSLYAARRGDPGAATARVRHFAPAAGVLEDPATGSAAGGLGACLAAAGLGDARGLRLTVLQGLELGRPSELAVRVDAPDGVPERVRVGGRVHLVLEGALAVA